MSLLHILILFMIFKSILHDFVYLPFLLKLHGSFFILTQITKNIQNKKLSLSLFNGSLQFPKSPFLQDYSPPNSTQRKLELPNKFVKNNGDSLLHNKATLCLPDGAIWKLQFKKSDAKICFLKGWPEFVQFYSIQPGHLLVFQLKSICCFNVLIFDTTATEIDYPMHQPPVLIPKSENEDEEESVRIANEAVLKKRRRENDKERAASCSLRETKKMMRKNAKMNKKHRESTSDEDEEDLETNYSRRQSNYRESEGRVSPESMRPMNRRKMPQALTENQLAVKKRASWFKCRRKNPSFMVTMRPSYIQTGNYLSLPRKFGERYIKESMDMKLEVGDGRSWRVWCGVRWAFTRRRTELKGGWKRFVEDNELKEGDICVFELMNKNAVCFKVAIFRLPNAEE